MLQQPVCRATFHVKHRPAEQQRDWDCDRLYAYGLRLLALRARSEQEVRQRFQQRAADADAVDAAIERLRAVGLVDDEVFAEAWVDSRRRASPRGDRLLRYELARKGIAPGIVAGAVSDVDAPSLARAAAVRKARSLAGEPEASFTRKLTEFLLRRGFDYDTTGQAVREQVSERLASRQLPEE